MTAQDYLIKNHQALKSLLESHRLRNAVVNVMEEYAEYQLSDLLDDAATKKEF